MEFSYLLYRPADHKQDFSLCRTLRLQVLCWQSDVQLPVCLLQCNQIRCRWLFGGLCAVLMFQDILMTYSALLLHQIPANHSNRHKYVNHCDPGENSVMLRLVLLLSVLCQRPLYMFWVYSAEHQIFLNSSRNYDHHIRVVRFHRM